MAMFTLDGSAKGASMKIGNLAGFVRQPAKEDVSR